MYLVIRGPAETDVSTVFRRRPVGTNVSIQKKTSWIRCSYLEEDQLGPIYLFRRSPVGTNQLGTMYLVIRRPAETDVSTVFRRRPVGTSVSIQKKTSWDSVSIQKKTTWDQCIYLEENQLGSVYLFRRRPADTNICVHGLCVPAMYAMSWKIPARNPAAEILLPRTHADALIKRK